MDVEIDTFCEVDYSANGILFCLCESELEAATQIKLCLWVFIQIQTDLHCQSERPLFQKKLI